MPYTTAALATFAISTTVPTAANDLAAMEALTYVEVDGIIQMGRVGDTANLVPLTTLQDGRQRNLLGSMNGGALELEVAWDGLQDGQLAMHDAFDSRDEYGFQIVINDGAGANPNTELYFKGLVTSVPFNIGTNDSVVTNTCAVTVNSEVWKKFTTATP